MQWFDRKSNNGYGYGQYTALDVLQAKKSCEKRSIMSNYAKKKKVPGWSFSRSSFFFGGGNELLNVATAFSASFWGAVVDKATTNIPGLGRMTNTIILDYIATSTRDSYPVMIEDQTIEEVTLQKMLDLYNLIASAQGKETSYEENLAIFR